MNVFTTKNDLNSHLDNAYAEKQTIGFVPTMGALHVGHISLINRALAENEVVVVSIFVNPTQFNNTEDLQKYPRTLAADIALLEEASTKIIVFAPSAEDLYNGVPKSKKYNFQGIENQMEGKFRPGHFDGVGTVVSHLFKAVKPTTAYFGEKDFQQLQVIKKLVQIEQLQVIIVGCPIYREKSGLAFSSRNERLTKQQRNTAKVIYKTLNTVKQAFGTKSVTDITATVRQVFEDQILFTLEYFEIAEIESLETTSKIEPDKKYRAFIAVFADEVRLIDNIALN